jgi:steroid delta-isomerase-like uncharacterized protein
MKHQQAGTTSVSPEQPYRGQGTDAVPREPDLSGPARQPEESNAQLVRALFQAYNAHDAYQINLYHATDYKGNAPGRQGMNVAQLIAYNQTFLDAFADLHFDLRRLIVQGDTVVAQWQASGTHTGPLLASIGNIPPTQKRVEIDGVSIFELQDGRVERSCIHWDVLSLLRQLGSRIATGTT